MSRPRLLLSGLFVVAALLAASCTSTVDGEVGPATAARTSTTTSIGADTTADPGEGLRMLPSGVVQVGESAAATVLDVYEDFMCPACAMFEDQYGVEITERITDGSLAVRHHDLNFLDQRSSSGDYSTRAAAAAQCVAGDGEASTYLAFRYALFAIGTQPREGVAADLTDADLADVAVDSGASVSAATCIVDGDKIDAATVAAMSSTTDLSDKTDGQVATPSVYDGESRVNISDPAWLESLAS